MNQWRSLSVKTVEQANLLIASVSYDKACSCGKGTRLAPKRLRRLSSFFPPATKDGEILTPLKIFDFGDIGNNRTSFNTIEKKASEIFDFNKFTLFLGGDHSVSIPLQKSFYEYCKKQNKIPAIIHIDAHPDFCDIYDDNKFSHASTNYRAMENGFKPEDIVLIGIRGYELQEIEFFKNHPEINIINASTIIKYGLDVVKKLKDKYDDKYAIYLSFDIDAIDPSFAPGTGTPEAFGITTEVMNEMINYFVENLPVKAMDIVEISPPLDVNDVTSWTALKLMYEVFYTIIKKNNFKA